MALDVSDVEKIAHLARLGIDPADIPEYSRNLSDILAFVEHSGMSHSRKPLKIPPPHTPLLSFLSKIEDR